MPRAIEQQNKFIGSRRSLLIVGAGFLLAFPVQAQSNTGAAPTGSQTASPAGFQTASQTVAKPANAMAPPPGKTPAASGDKLPESGPAPPTTSSPATIPPDSLPLASQTGTPVESSPHRLKMKLSGSMCLACLKELERRMTALTGVKQVKIEYPGDNLYEFYSLPGGASYASATIRYDASLESLDALLGFLRGQGYHPYKVLDSQE